MSKPDDIPQDVWEEAFDVMITAGAAYFNQYYGEDEPGDPYENGLVVSAAPFVARAILAERERCAKAVEALEVPAQQSNSWQLGFMRARKNAAAAIRKGGSNA